MIAKYADYVGVFSSDLTIELPENMRINEYTIKLIDDKQPAYRPIYALSPEELEILKIYIKTHLKTGFIQPTKSLISTPIVLDKRPNDSLCLYINYQGLNNLSIKNRYSLHLIKNLYSWT